MPLDPLAVDYLNKLAAAGFPAANTVSPQEARELASKRRALFPDWKADVARVEDRPIPGPSGDLPCRVYTPSGPGTFPIVVYFHGGGWVIGSLDTHDSVCRMLANDATAVVLSVEYRLAPEDVFPAAAEDAYAATVWVARNGAEIGGDGSRLAVAGDSAGGNLAAAVTLMARDRGGPSVGFQLLIYPVSDHDFETDSYRELGEGYALTREGMQWFWDLYVPNQADRDNPYASPSRAASLSGLPPAHVITAEFDPLRDEGEQYASRLQAAGVPTTVRRFPGLLHGFVSSPGVFPQAKEAIREAGAAMRAALRT